jgi:Domain of unknown function (DUF4168)
MPRLPDQLEPLLARTCCRPTLFRHRLLTASGRSAAAAAIERVASLKQDYQQRIAAAAPDDKERILNEAVNALAKAITDQGLSVEEYDSILEVAQNDLMFARKFVSASVLRPNSRSSSRARWPASLRS